MTAVGDGGGAGIGGGWASDAGDVTVAGGLVAYCGGGQGRTALTAEQKASDVAKLLNGSDSVSIGELSLGEQQGAVIEGEPGSAAFGLPAVCGAGILGESAILWEGESVQSVTCSWADGTLTVATSAETRADSYVFRIAADEGVSDASELVVAAGTGASAQGAGEAGQQVAPASEDPAAPRALPEPESPQASPGPAALQASPGPVLMLLGRLRQLIEATW